MEQQLGETIRALREAAGIAQVTLAERLGMSRSTLCNYEAGRETMSGERYDECFFMLKALVAERDTAWESALAEARLTAQPLVGPKPAAVAQRQAPPNQG